MCSQAPLLPFLIPVAALIGVGGAWLAVRKHGARGAFWAMVICGIGVVLSLIYISKHGNGC